MTNPGTSRSSIGSILTVRDSETQWSLRVPTRKVDRPLQDEFGMFDPARCGIAAILARLEKRKPARSQ